MPLRCGVGEDSWSPLDSKEFKPVSLKGNQPWIFRVGRTDAEAEAPVFGHLMQAANWLEKTLMLGKIEGRRRRGWQRMKWLDGITYSIDMNLGKLQEMVIDGEACHVAIHRVANSWTWFGDWTTTNNKGLSIKMVKKNVELTYPTITSDVHLNVWHPVPSLHVK